MTTKTMLSMKALKEEEGEQFRKTRELESKLWVNKEPWQYTPKMVNPIGMLDPQHIAVKMGKDAFHKVCICLKSALKQMTLTSSLNKDLVTALLSNLQIAFSTSRGIWFCIIGTSFTYALATSTMEYALFKVGADLKVLIWSHPEKVSLKENPAKPPVAHAKTPASSTARSPGAATLQSAKNRKSSKSPGLMGRLSSRIQKMSLKKNKAAKSPKPTPKEAPRVPAKSPAMNTARSPFKKKSSKSPAKK
ncbi:hypothetical protein Ddc_01647 [Ditylenchus destructor]|nr:hypothetical protein Ddc_01647 [Ditylenchus destructor]